LSDFELVCHQIEKSFQSVLVLFFAIT